MQSPLSTLLIVATAALAATAAVPAPNAKNTVIIRNESNREFSVRLGGAITVGKLAGTDIAGAKANTKLDGNALALDAKGGERKVAAGKTLTLEFPNNLPKSFMSAPDGCAYAFTVKDPSGQYQHFSASRGSSGALAIAALPATVVGAHLTAKISGNTVSLPKGSLYTD